jgi:N-acylglucosamine-6-phosphate 2-epimerase
MVAMAQAARIGGAVGIRAEGPADVRGIKRAVDLPVIGLFKKHYPGFDVYITPTMAEVGAIAQAGADMVAVQLTDQPRPDGLSNAAFVAAIRDAFPRLPIMADISTLAEGLTADALGVDLISTTMSGYTPASPQQDGPDLALVRALVPRVGAPVVAEGRIRTPAECRAALAAGAYAVVVGTAITRPQTITAWFVAEMRGARPGHSQN